LTNPLPLLLGMPGGWEWLIILVVCLLLFGNRIPGLARSLGSGINEFKAGLREGDKKPGGDAAPKEPGTAEKRP
jgi:sec-independent protein translocase protein TatA